MNKNTILELTLAQFGLMQEPPIEENTLCLIGTFATVASDNPGADLMVEVNEIASGKWTSEEIKDSFLRRFEEDTRCLSVTTVSDVIKGWFGNANKYAKNEDWSWRSFQNLRIMSPFLNGLQYLGFPEEDIQKLRLSAEYVAKWRPPERDTSNDAGP